MTLWWLSSAPKGHAQAAPSSSPPGLLAVPNTAFDPLVDPSGASVFAGITGESVPSDLGVDYVLVQRDQRRTRAWLDTLRARGLEIVGLYENDTVLARCVPPCPAPGSGPNDLPDVRWMGNYLPAYKPSWSLAPGADLSPFDVGAPGSPRYWVGALLHRAEAPGGYVAAVLAGLPCALEVGPTESLSDPVGIAPTIHVLVPAGCLFATRDFLARMEAVLFVEITGEQRPFLSDDSWVLQTGVPPAGGVYNFDLQAKLFAHGVTGKGQVINIPDGGLENDDCHFRYGPHLSDVTTPPPAVIPLPDTYTTPAPWYQPTNKVVAQYLLPQGIRGFPPNPPYPPEVLPGDHGTFVSAVALGDDHAFLAARAGQAVDDPFRDESPPSFPGDATVSVDHHQEVDGVAPGAQLIFQAFTGLEPDEQSASPSLTLADIVRQAYATVPGSRVLSYSWGPQEVPDYTSAAQRTDHAAWLHRDYMGAIACGNTGADDRQDNPTLSGFAQTKNFLAVGGSDSARFGSLPTALMNAGPPLSVDCPGGARSSYGPGVPDRLKPDLVAPGEWILMPYGEGTPELGDGSAPDECAMRNARCSGTSYAAPAIAGLSALVRQYFVEGYYPSGSPGLRTRMNPTGALVKAILINSARALGGPGTGDYGLQPITAPSVRPSFGQGWGLPVLDDVLFFPGDPTNPGERSRMLVLNDAPNGFTGAHGISDGRAVAVENFLPALTEPAAGGPRPIHEFPVRVSAGEPFHVTLAWTDVVGEPASGQDAAHPLRNDLDLEVVDPAGRVWRPRPGNDGASPPSGVADPDRLWSGGYSILGVSACPQPCACAGQPERLTPQDAAAPCDFKGRDAANTVENVFIPAAAIQPGTYTIRVIGFRISGDGLVGVIVRPNYATGDGSEEHDVINDTDQGYALVASGRIAGARAIVHFDRAMYACDGTGQFMATVTVVDADAVSPVEVTLRSDVGDCETLLLSQVAGEPVFAAGVIVQDILTSLATPSCDASDGVLLVGAAGTITATTADGAVAVARARCRDVRMGAVTVEDGCSTVGLGTALNRQAVSRVSFVVENALGLAVESAWFRVRPNRPDVIVLGDGAVLLTVPGPAGAGLQGGFVAYMRDDGLPCEPAPVQFEVDVYGARGFHSRLFLQAGVDCTVAGALLEGDLPGEVPPTSLRVAKEATGDITLTFDPAPGAIEYNAWRGSIAALQAGTYDHEVRTFVGACDQVSPVVIPTDAAGPGNWYYLISGEVECAGDLPLALEGTTGHADRDRGLLGPALPPRFDERRPLGRLGAGTGCDP